MGNAFSTDCYVKLVDYKCAKFCYLVDKKFIVYPALEEIFQYFLRASDHSVRKGCLDHSKIDNIAKFLQIWTESMDEGRPISWTWNKSEAKQTGFHQMLS